ncbi:MAG TPA: twin-arginine translocase subunit TatC, partial [Gammaproteobacteria bacterium]|nr:twin-arginine translocase subunit TatC [Gammaproteobacteria bacterium]
MNNTVEQLLELRTVLLRCFASVALIFLILLYYAKPLYHLLATPLLKFLPKGSQMIAIDVATPFLVPMKLALTVAIFIAIPFIFYQLWRFIAPGLYQYEKKFFVPVFCSSLILFYSGILFAYFIVLPLTFSFFIYSAPEGVRVMTDIAAYLSFVLNLFFAFGLAFQIPIVIFVLAKLKIINPEKFGVMRPYVIIGAFVVGMLLTPPDVISQ